MRSAGPPVVIGVGEEFRRDDGVGPAVVAELRRRAAAGALPPDTRLEVCFGEPAGLIELWHGARLAVVVDAAAGEVAAGEVAAGEVASGPAVGNVLRWEVPGTGAEATGTEATAPVLSAGPAATHGLGPGAAIALGRVLERMPGRLVLFAVVGGDFGPGPGLSPAVAEAVRRVAADIADEVGRGSADRDAADIAEKMCGEGLSARSDEDLGSWSAGDAPRKLDS